MAKQIVSEDNARKALKRGIDAVANSVKITLGPRGRNVALDKGYGSPVITNDGVSIAKEIELSDKIENIGASIIKEVASKTNELAGDGTSTAVVLTQAIVSEGMKRTAMGANAMGVRLGIEAAVVDAVSELKKLAKPIKTGEEIKQIASISAESKEIGSIIAETINKVGNDGVVTVEESQSLGVESEVVEGLQFERGYVSPYMVTNMERMESDMRDVPILITDRKISTINEVLPLLEKLAASGRKELFIIAEDVTGEALATFVLNKMRGNFNIVAVKSPGFGDNKKDQLQDIAVTTGGQVVSEEMGIKLENAELDVLGRASKVLVTKDKTVIVDGKGTKTNISERISQVKQLLTQTESKFDREKLEQRIAKLSGGVAIIKVGAATETEMKYLKLKVEDAVNATKAAIDEGIVPGGGTALVKVAHKMRENSKKDERFTNTQSGIKNEFIVGYNIVVDALSAPLAQIATNGGINGFVIVEKVVESKNNFGYDALNDTMVDMLAVGIIDPVKVTRCGLQNAASAAAILLTTEVAIAEEPKKEEDHPQGYPGGMGY